MNKKQKNLGNKVKTERAYHGQICDSGYKYQCQHQKCWGKILTPNFILYLRLTSRPTIHNLYPTAFPYGNGMVLHFCQQQESSTTKTVHRVINKGLKAYV